MNVRNLNPKLQRRVEAVQRAMDAGLPSASEVSALADWLGSGVVVCGADAGGEIAAALEAFRLAHDRAHACDPHLFRGGYAAAIDVMETMVEYARAAQAVLDLKNAGRLRLAASEETESALRAWRLML